MKNFFITILTSVLLLFSCNSYIDNQLSKRDEQISKLEELCKGMNDDIESLKKIISALQNNASVTSVTPIVVDGVEVGYTITFSNGDAITIYHGKDGENGKDGINGSDGKDGVNGTDGKDGDSLFISVEQDEKYLYLTLVDGSVVTIPKQDTQIANKIYYTTINNKKLFPSDSNATLFGAILISNTYNDGQGVMVFDDTVTEIGASVFQECTNLKSIVIPDGVTEIGTNAFQGCSNLVEVTFGSGVTRIGDSAFQSCVNLKSVTIPKNITYFGINAFYNCSSLSVVDIEDLAAWCGNTFAESASNPLSNGGKLYINGIESTHITIPEEVSAINSFILEGCTNISNITISSGVKSINPYAFFYCVNLKSVTIPSSVTSIGELAFVGCSKLSTFNGDYASKDSRSLIIDNVLVAFAPAGATTYTLPEQVTKINNFVFCMSSELKSITLNDRITAISDYAFLACEALEGITFPSNVTKIGDSSFYGCQSLENIDFNKVNVIDSNAFCGCSSLKSITIPIYVQSIGAYAFSDCRNLANIYLQPTVPPVISSNSFDGNASGRKFYVPRSSEQIYEQALGWKGYAAAIEPYDFE